ncbi:MAG: hypothetical protein COZ75_13670 [Flavobacteriaceae bacterium CG_4_8_14_3_um_filter_34_10]|nr:hypothetical protein [Flavobacteriia bacterium]OIP50632.1 MAG: hypothetical protein AUK33_06665 [Flavobacteriaceae bacterium CG2_30_34_30]PIQ17369.1 MAG: hypothetical protein COW66_12220 [Flavobacteriaceae bacterium CG18_big_fil_WC_8_21_14_2_50_34_36]PIV50803.1 MAG: hypothetical protein COS19_03340 [Flavobacteriaceae bacterium CG02_land_8_20_14_3_00_34_13]PIX08106.1 MAG: hypothetical protein COZ75_13670 [Flavobacteriaceae bacterium CG_4_8_14_3_um_filter_34_10]PIZ07821.1 MAG: hypothetical pr
MKNQILSILVWSLIFSSCKGDGNPSCITCDAELTNSFELCKESDGTASVNGENTGVSYSIYLDGLLNEGVTCN